MKAILIACAVAISSPAVAGSAIQTSPMLNFDTAPPHLVYYGGGQKMIFDIGPDGTVTLGKDVTPNEAANAFWKAVQQMFPQACHASP